MTITSLDNKIIKETAALKMAKNRKESRLFAVEGARLVFDVLNALNVKYIFVREGDEQKYLSIFEKYGDKSFVVSARVFKKISDTDSPQGILAVLEQPKNEFFLPQGNFLILDRISDPANLGAILRTAAATEFLDVYLFECTDAYSPKAVRASMGGFAFCRIADINLEDLDKLKQAGILYAADMSGENAFDCELNTGEKRGLIVGNEGAGVSYGLLEISHKILSIPMNNIESLNAAVAASILMYRLREKKF